METASVAEVKQHIDEGNRLAGETAAQTYALGEAIIGLEPTVLADGLDKAAAALRERAGAADQLPYNLVEDKRAEAEDIAAAALQGTSTDFAGLAGPYSEMKRNNGEAAQHRSTFVTVLGEVATAYTDAATRLREEATGHITAGKEATVTSGAKLNDAVGSAGKYRTNL